MLEATSRPLRTAGSRALRAALVQVLFLAAVVAAIEIALYPTLAGRNWVLLAFSALGVHYVLVGAIAWARRPSNRMGPLLVLGGCAILAAAAGNTTLEPLAQAGQYAAVLPLAVLVHLLLGFPSGRLRTLAPRLLTAFAYVSTITIEVSRFHGADPATCDQAQDVAGWVVVGGSVVLLVGRARAATAHERRTLTPLYAYGVFTLLLLVFSSQVLGDLLGADPYTVFIIQLFVLAGIPLAFLAGVLRGGFARTGELEELGAWLGTADDARPTLRDALASTLGDPTVELWFWLPDEERFVDAEGARVSAQDRRSVDVELRGERVGAIAYDDRLIADPDTVRAAGRVIAVALDRERLLAGLQANQRALAESRSRIVAAEDRERRRIARDLHDGVQSRLVAMALRAGMLADDPATPAAVAADAEALRATADATVEELRGLVQGVMPALLVERGLGAATEDLVDRVPVPTDLEVVGTHDDLPEEVETAAYFVVAEALTNAVKHANATRVHVRIGREDDVLAVEVHDDGVGGATGVTSLRDRVDALGGRLEVHSPAAAGTRVRVELPCA